ncbi:MAG: hypothetical protein IMF10_06675, partial [Proteobacteria bacterium]|nr:hypothetical protein [Pseudomonadota bacterium]
MAAKVVKRKKGEDSWSEVTFPRASGGFRSKYSSPSLKVGKYGLGIYCTDLQGDTQVKIFSNGSKIGICPDDSGSKK